MTLQSGILVDARPMHFTYAARLFAQPNAVRKGKRLFLRCGSVRVGGASPVVRDFDPPLDPCVYRLGVVYVKFIGTQADYDKVDAATAEME